MWSFTFEWMSAYIYIHRKSVLQWEIIIQNGKNWFPFFHYYKTHILSNAFEGYIAFGLKKTPKYHNIHISCKLNSMFCKYFCILPFCHSSSSLCLWWLLLLCYCIQHRREALKKYADIAQPGNFKSRINVSKAKRERSEGCHVYARDGEGLLFEAEEHNFSYSLSKALSYSKQLLTVKYPARMKMN